LTFDIVLVGRCTRLCDYLVNCAFEMSVYYYYYYCSGEVLFQFALKPVHSFSKYIAFKIWLRTKEGTNELAHSQVWITQFYLQITPYLQHYTSPFRGVMHWASQ